VTRMLGGATETVDRLLGSPQRGNPRAGPGGLHSTIPVKWAAPKHFRRCSIKLVEDDSVEWVESSPARA
jgi:hypothetical protein